MSSLQVNQKIVAVVPVRAGSKGLPGKNLRVLAGAPLYLRAIEQGLRTVGSVFLSTDITQINEDDLPIGCKLCSRPAELAADDTPMAHVLHHLIVSCNLSDKTILLLQATSPLRVDNDILASIELYKTGGFDMVMSVVERDRGILKYGTLDGNRFRPMRDPGFCFQNRQALPRVYGPNGAVYVFSAQRFLDAGGFPAGKIGAIEMPEERSADIDTSDDFLRVEQILLARREVRNNRI